MRGAAGRLRRLLLEEGGEIELSALKRRFPTPALATLIRQLRSRGYLEEEYRLRLPAPAPAPYRPGSCRQRVSGVGCRVSGPYRPTRHPTPDTRHLPSPRRAPAARPRPSALPARRGGAAGRSLSGAERDAGGAPVAGAPGLVRAGEATVNRAARAPLARVSAPPFTTEQAAAASVLDDAVRRRAAESFLLFASQGVGRLRSIYGQWRRRWRRDARRSSWSPRFPSPHRSLPSFAPASASVWRSFTAVSRTASGSTSGRASAGLRRT